MKFYRILIALFNMFLLVPLAFFGYQGLFSRYIADDFCTSAYLKTMGYVQSIQFWRATWSGRFSFYIFMNISHWLGEWITPLLAALTILIWLGALYFFARLLLRALGVQDGRLFSLFFGAVIVFAIFDGTPDIYQSLYWHTGVVTYTFPLVILTFYAAFLLDRLSTGRLTRVDIALSAGIPFIAGGFSETYGTLQLSALLALLGYILVFQRGDSRQSSVMLLGPGLLGALAALVLVVAAPGNDARMSLMPEHIRGFPLVLSTARYTYFFSKLALYHTPLSAAAALLAPGLLVLYLPKKLEAAPLHQLLPFLLLIPLGAFLLIASTIVPSLYAIADYPPGRALVTAQFVLISAFATWSLLLGLALRNPLKKYVGYLLPAYVILGLLFLAASVSSVRETLVSLPEVQAFAELWDRRDKEVRQTASQRVVDEIQAESLPHISPGLAELSYDEDNWVNKCFAWHYGLKRVSAK